jgi:hypothetical protein
MSIISCTSPNPSATILPASIETSLPSCALQSRNSWPRSLTNSPRRGAGTCRHFRNAACAAAMASANSATLCCRTEPTISPLIGERACSAPALSSV